MTPDRRSPNRLMRRIRPAQSRARSRGWTVRGPLFRAVPHPPLRDRKRARGSVAAVAAILLTVLVGCAPSRSVSTAGGASAGCAPPALAGSVVHVELSDSGAGMVSGGMMGGGMGGSASMMQLTLRSDRGEVTAARPVSFLAHNGGGIVHELVVLQLPVAVSAGALVVQPDNKVDEAGSRGEASRSCSAGAGDGLQPGTTGWVTLSLATGQYALVCNEPGHYAAGMRVDFSVVR